MGDIHILFLFSNGCLKDLAKARGLKGVSALRKPELIERMLHEDELEGETKKQEAVREKPQQSEVEGNGERIPQYNKTPERTHNLPRHPHKSVRRCFSLPEHTMPNHSSVR